MARSPSSPADDPASGTLDASRPLGVYVHFPFCRARCPYCDFATAVREPIPHDEYAAAVTAELSARVGWFRAENTPDLRSIYFGGGTPGLWHPGAVASVIETTRRLLGTTGPLEITVEANPGEVTEESVRRLRAAGVNRVSLGVQAFQDHLLAVLGRRHDLTAIAAAVRAVRAAGIDNLCADLMFGLPGQTMEDWHDSLAALVALAPQHITAYALTVEPRTRFGALERAGQLPRPDDATVAAMYASTHETLQGAGFEHYEISSYAWPGRRAVHNTLYWTGGAYLGVGVSASSFRPLSDGSGWRFSNPRGLQNYLRSAAAHQGSPEPVQVERRSPRDLENEGLWLGLRTSDGVDRAAHARRYGQDPLASSARAAAARTCVDAGWLSVAPDRIRLTAAGFLFADEVSSRLWQEK